MPVDHVIVPDTVEAGLSSMTAPSGAPLVALVGILASGERYTILLDPLVAAKLGQALGRPSQLAGVNGSRREDE